MKVTLLGVRRVPQDLYDPKHVHCTRQQWGVPSEGTHGSCAGALAKKPIAGCSRSRPRALSCRNPLSCQSGLTFHIPSQQQMAPEWTWWKDFSFSFSCDGSWHLWSFLREIQILFEFWLFTHSKFIWFLAKFSPIIIVELCVLLWYVDIYNRDHQRWYRFPLLIGVLWGFSNIILRKADKLTCWRQWEYYNLF